MSFQIQQQIKRNAQEIRTYVSDLYDWQHQMELKQKAKTKLLKQQRQRQSQIAKEIIKENKEMDNKTKNKDNHKQKEKQNKKIIENQLNHQNKPDLIRDTNTIKDYYNAWDKFDIDSEIKRLEDEQTRPYRPYNPYENSQNYIRAKPKAKMNINIKSQRAAVIDPSQLKDKGNLHYKVCEYEKAIDAYSQCIEKLREQQQSQKNSKLKSVVLSNRAMTYMKINERAKALNDCNESLKYDPFYVKSYLRRADCHKKLGNYRDSLKDFRKVKELDPNDKDVQSEIKKIENYLQKLFKEARESLIVSNVMNVIPNSYRVAIQEIDQFQNPEQNNKENKVNYLQQL